ncbi:metallophosphoesterase [Solimicrobium silvestre]|uniref:Calcineurin-like phosphoesterase n=1 Tax=Solimicrobium silvestre TaxID=2099400 RepID=A0A2S9H237_9BURK|nr:metallophosphoesterase [Solimicrobium silvestre]PRC94039.1 Calcineurin-like phosphoesterase [Solimicrobium silvestre]
MKIVILHLSDIHFKQSDNPIENQLQLISNAVKTIEPNAEDLSILVTGDIANTGNENEYIKASIFFKALEARIRELQNFKNITWCFSPGNHDCDFSNPSKIRSELLEMQKKHSVPSIDDEILECLLKPQKNFRKFVDECHPKHSIDRHYYSASTIYLGNDKINIHNYNTAISSSITETQGDLFFPISQLPSIESAAEIVISCFHHPYNWLESNNAREFRKHVESTSDLILSGHEHVPGHYNKTDLLSKTNSTYFEGAVLQNHKNPSESGFNAFVLDIERKLIKTFVFNLSEGLYRANTNNPDWIEFQRNKNRVRNEFEINSSYIDRFLADPGAGFTNSRKGKLEFQDIFVPGYLDEISRLDESKDLVIPAVPMANFTKSSANKNRILIIGEEQSGKTSFAKYLYMSYHESGLIPIFMRASMLKDRDIEDTHFRNRLFEAISDQYSPDLQETFLQLPIEKKVLLLDDLHLSPFNQKGLGRFIEHIENQFGKIILFSHALSFVDELANAATKNDFAHFSQYEVKPFGNQLREQLIERWYLIGKEYTVNELELEKMVVNTKRTVDGLLGKNLLPSYPIFILIILQQLEASTNLNTYNGAHGYLYELLITSAITNANTKIDLDTAYTFLGMLAESMFQRKTRFVTKEEISEIHKEFCEFSKQTIRLEKIEKPLLDANILIEHDQKYWFRYKYCYYYFAARFLSDRLRTETGQARLSLLGGEIYREEYANILMFLAYLSNKDQSIIDVMLRNAKSIYVGVAACDFDEHIKFINKMHADLPKSILLDRKTSHSRAEINQRLDEFDHVNGSLQKQNEDVDDALKLNVALKTIQVLGQLLKNFPSSLDGNIKKEIADQCYQLGLRTMTKFFQFAEENQEGLITLFDDWLGNVTAKETEISLKPKAEQFIAFLIEAFSTVVIRRVSSAVGVASLAPLYEEIRNQYSGLSVNMIDYAIKLDHFERFPLEEIDAIIKEAKNNIFPLILLRRLTIEHFQRFPVDRKVKQSACTKLKIELKYMQLLENKQKKMG